MAVCASTNTPGDSGAPNLPAVPRPRGPDTVSLYLRVPPELHKRLRNIAEYEGRSVNSQATRLLQAGVAQYEDEHRDELGLAPD